MTDILILWNQDGSEPKIEKLFIIEFFKKFKIYQVIISNLGGWESFLLESGLDINYIPDYYESGFSNDDLQALESHGYIEDTECYSLDCFSVNGNVFASPYQEHIETGEHLTDSFQKLLWHIEKTHNCQIFYKLS